MRRLFACGALVSMACGGAQQRSEPPPPSPLVVSTPTPLPTPTRLAPTPVPRPEFTPVAPPTPLATPTPTPRPLPTPTPTPAPTADPARTAALAAERALARTFVPALPSSEAEEGPVKSVPGFKELDGMDVRKAVKVPGRAELEWTPEHVKPGDSYTVRVYLRNQDKKKQKLRIVHVKALNTVNGQDSRVEVSWKPLEVKHGERPLVASLSGRWGDDVTSWSLAVKVFVENGDAYENRLVWK